MPERVHHRFDGHEAVPRLKQIATNKVGIHSLGTKRKRGARLDVEAPKSISRDKITTQTLVQAENGDIRREIGNTRTSDRTVKSLPAMRRVTPVRPEKTEPALPVQHERNLTTKSERQVNTANAAPNQGKLKARARSLQSIRQSLPIWSHRAEILRGLTERDVMLLVGETGSGKSTQVPQFLVEAPWCRPHTVNITTEHGTKTAHVGGCIAITEPRRVAAITLARRIAEEMGTPLGSSSPASKVGYSVRFDKSTSPCTRIKFLTEGMLLQEMLQDPWLHQYSGVIVDEVHERGSNVDLILGFLRHIVTGKNEGRGGIKLKIAVMSATTNMESLLEFFESGFRTLSLGEAGFIAGKDLGEAPDNDPEWTGISSGDEGSSTRGDTNEPCNANGEGNGAGHKSQVSVCHIEGRQFPVQTIYSPEPVQDFIDAALRTIFQIHYKEPLPGDILVFLTGQETVESLQALVEEYAQSMGAEVPKLIVLPLFAALPQAAQQQVFLPPPFKTRKVILATNIAETSVTVTGVKFVVDCGKSKVKQFRSRLGLDSLLVKPISKSSAIQRKGRAGREAAGQCHRLYTEQDFLSLQPSNTPEILRCDLSQAILTMKARGVQDITSFPFLDRPPREALGKAMMQLYQLGALHDSGEINNIGLQIAKLPLSASLGRVLLAAAAPEMDCLMEAIDVVSCLSVENIFLNLTSEEKKEEAETARRGLSRREGDHLTMLATVQAYAAENVDKKAWAARHFVSHRAMQAVMVSADATCEGNVLTKIRTCESNFERKLSFSKYQHK